jgi:hypothetical protein
MLDRSSSGSDVVVVVIVLACVIRKGLRKWSAVGIGMLVGMPL